MTAFYTPHHPNQIAFVKSEPLTHETMSSSVQSVEPEHQPYAVTHYFSERPLLPPIRTISNDNDMRRLSTYSVASSQSSYLTTSEATSPVAPVGDLALYERGIRAIQTAAARLQQVGNHLGPSPYSSPEPSSQRNRRIVQKSKARAKARSIRGVQSHSGEDDSQEDDTAGNSTARSVVKKMREQESRKELSWSLAGLASTLLRVNPNIEAEGITRTGTQGLRRLKSNNIDHDIAQAGIEPLVWNKDVTVDLAAIIIGNFLDLVNAEIESHRNAGRWDEAQRLSERLASVSTTLDRPRQGVWDAIPGLRETMVQREKSKRGSSAR